MVNRPTSLRVFPVLTRHDADFRLHSTIFAYTHGTHLRPLQVEAAASTAADLAERLSRPDERHEPTPRSEHRYVHRNATAPPQVEASASTAADLAERLSRAEERHDADVGRHAALKEALAESSLELEDQRRAHTASVER